MPSDNDNDNDAKAEKGLDVEAFYDSDCPVCSREVDWLRNRDVFQRIRFVDVATPGFDPGRDAGMPIDRLGDCIQARLETGEVLEGADAFRRLYEVACLERAQRLQRTPLLSPVVGLGSRWLAEQRMRRACRRVGRACACLRKAG